MTSLRNYNHVLFPNQTQYGRRIPSIGKVSYDTLITIHIFFLISIIHKILKMHTTHNGIRSKPVIEPFRGFDGPDNHKV